MANWCSNWVTIKGDGDNVQALFEELEQLQMECESTGLGVRPNDNENLEYMHDLYVEKDYISFESRWAPVNDTLKYLARKHDLTIINRYSEPSNLIFGEWQSDGETEEGVYLEDSDWDLITSNYEEDIYFYKGEEYECEEDILDIILDEKLQGLLHREKNIISYVPKKED